jgi:hypothetical protein
MSEDEINEKFPLPMIPGEPQLYPQLEDDNDCPLLKMLDPFQVIDKDIDCLWQNGEPHKSTAFSTEISDFMDEDENSSLCSREESLGHREGIDDERDTVCASRESYHHLWTDDSDAMDIECESEVEEELPNAKSAPSFEWAIESHYNQSQSLCFKLKMSGGAYMLLLEDEILDSITVLLEETMTNIIFKVLSIDGNSLLVDSSQVMAKMAEIIETETRKRRIEGRDEYEDERLHGSSPSRKILRIPSLGRRRPRDCGTEKTRRPNNPLNSAWRALSGRAKIRPRPPARVE